MPLRRNLLPGLFHHESRDCHNKSSTNTFMRSSDPACYRADKRINFDSEEDAFSRLEKRMATKNMI
jgi:hypothetical protein